VNGEDTDQNLEIVTASVQETNAQRKQPAIDPDFPVDNDKGFPEESFDAGYIDSEWNFTMVSGLYIVSTSGKRASPHRASKG
jgi:hypothetical protein